MDVEEREDDGRMRFPVEGVFGKEFVDGRMHWVARGMVYERWKGEGGTW